MQPVGLTYPWLVVCALLGACATQRAPVTATELNAPPALHHTVPTPDVAEDSPPADAGAVDAASDAAPTPDAAPDAAPTPDAAPGDVGGPAPDMAVARDAVVDARIPPVPDMGAPPAPDAAPMIADAGPPGRLIFTGPSPDDRTVAGLVIVDGQISFYVCGSGETLTLHTWWLFGEVGADGAVDLADDDHFWLDGRVEGDRFRGTYGFPMSEDTLELDLPLAAPDARSEMYELLDLGCLTGVVVIENGEETPRIQGAWCNGEGLVLQVTPVLPFAPEERGLDVTVEMPDGPSRLLTVTPVLRD